MVPVEVAEWVMGSCTSVPRDVSSMAVLPVALSLRAINPGMPRLSTTETPFLLAQLLPVRIVQSLLDVDAAKLHRRGLAVPGGIAVPLLKLPSVAAVDVLEIALLYLKSTASIRSACRIAS